MGVDMTSIFSKYKKHLRPEFLVCCSRLLKERPEEKQAMLKILEYCKEESKKLIDYGDISLPWLCPPHKWLAENFKKGHVYYSNGLFWIHVKQNKNNANVVAIIDTAWFGPKGKEVKLPFKKRKETFKNIWEAMWFIGFLQEQLDVTYLQYKSKKKKHKNHSNLFEWITWTVVFIAGISLILRILS